MADLSDFELINISGLPSGTAAGSNLLAQDDGSNTTKITINQAVAASQAMQQVNNKIGSTALPTTAQTLTGAIAEHEADLTALNGKFSAIIGYKTVDVGSVTILADGYLSLNSYRPATPTGYQFMFALVNAWSSTTSKTAINITDNGTWLIGTGGDTITGLKIDYFYIKVGCLGTLT